MSFIAWSEEMKVGNDTIDEHHRYLVDLLNNAHDSFVYGMKKGELKNTINALLEYADYHFSAEEKIMQDCNYPDMADHIADHHAFSATVNQMHSMHKKDNHPAYLEITDFLLEWLIRHINIADRAIFEYLQPSKANSPTKLPDSEDAQMTSQRARSIPTL